MRHRIIVALLSLWLAAFGLVGAVAAQDAPTKRVGLVIGFPDGSRHLEIVTVSATANTFQVLQAAKVELASQDTGYGQGVCSINQVGCPASDCFCDPAHFWAYYHLDATANRWVSAAEGASAYVPADGSVEGFAWSGFDAAYNATTQPPLFTFPQIVAETSPQPVAVPEPATLLLVGAGLASLAGYVRRAQGRRTAEDPAEDA